MPIETRRRDAQPGARTNDRADGRSARVGRRQCRRATRAMEAMLSAAWSLPEKVVVNAVASVTSDADWVAMPNSAQRARGAVSAWWWLRAWVRAARIANSRRASRRGGSASARARISIGAGASIPSGGRRRNRGISLATPTRCCSEFDRDRRRFSRRRVDSGNVAGIARWGRSAARVCGVPVTVDRSRGHRRFGATRRRRRSNDPVATLREIGQNVCRWFAAQSVGSTVAWQFQRAAAAADSGRHARDSVG